MDRGGVKRPRSGTPDSTSTKKKDKDKTKKKKKNKPNPKKSDGGADDTTNSLEQTATADGQYMAKILSTFTKMEQSRFEAFKRVSFPCNAISRYVAFCLHERQQPQRYQHDALTPNPNNTKIMAVSSSSSGAAVEPPQLQDLVVPGQEDDITTVVATLAKAYAQRLVAAARNQQQHDQQGSTSSSQQQPNNSTGGGESGASGALKPQHVLSAFYSRKQQGLDPGFFLQPNDCITFGGFDGCSNQGGTLTSSGKHQMKRVAALAAQDDFDRHLEEFKEFLKKHPPPSRSPSPEPESEEGAANDDNGNNDNNDNDDDDNQDKNNKNSSNVKKEDRDSDSGDDDEMDLEAELEKEMS